MESDNDGGPTLHEMIREDVIEKVTFATRPRQERKRERQTDVGRTREELPSRGSSGHKGDSRLDGLKDQKGDLCYCSI